MPAPNTPRRQPRTAPPNGRTRPSAPMPDNSQLPTRSSGLEPHRLLASVALVAMLLFSLVPTRTYSAPNPAIFITPQITGEVATPNYVALGTINGDTFSAVFPYRSLIERGGFNINSVWPEAGDALSYDPASLRARRAIVGQLYASSSGALDVKIIDSGLESAPTQEKLEGIGLTYQQMLSGNDQAPRGVNGIASLDLLRALTAPADKRAELERGSIIGLQRAISLQPTTWQFSYNWSLANLLVGNYAAAYEGLRGVRFKALADKELLPYYWFGVAALRLGNPGDAILAFQEAMSTQAPEGANDALIERYNQLHTLAREGIADAQAANRNPGEAYRSYLDLLQLGTVGSGVYNKWLRLGMQQHAYESLVRDIKQIYSSSTPDVGLAARLHHDRARLLSLLGRNGEALDEYREAVRIGESDPTLLVSYGEGLEAAGDHDGALRQAEAAIGKLGKDPAGADLSSVAATTVATSTTSLDESAAAQQLLSANLLRARVWGNRGQTDLIGTLASQIKAGAANLPPGEAGLLNLYAAFAFEAGGQNKEARDSYHAAWDALGKLPVGQPGRGAALAGWARTEAAVGDASAGLDTLKQNGYDPTAPPSSVATDPDAAAIYTQAGVLLDAAGRKAEAANALRVAAIVANLQDVRQLSGVGRSLWTANGTQVPADGMLSVADAQRRAGGDLGLAGMRYEQAYSLKPALAPAFNNLGVLYANAGDAGKAQFYFQSAGAVSPNYTLGRRNLSSYAYKQGLGNFFTGEAARAGLIKSAGPAGLGYDIQADERGGLPAPFAPQTDFLLRLPALLLIALLLAHTLVGRDRQTNRMGLVPTRGVLGTLAQAVNARIEAVLPALGAARPGALGAIVSILAPSLVGMLALAWHAGQGQLDVALVYLPVALLAALVAFGVNELTQGLAARRMGAMVLHRTSPFGLLLGLLTAPFGLMYGWGVTTQPQAGEGLEGRQETAGANAGVMKRLGLGDTAEVMFAGLLANLVVGILFGLGYWLTGWPSLRLAMLASMLVAAFSAVSEPPADGWSVYRRNPALWLALFVLAAAISALLVGWMI